MSQRMMVRSFLVAVLSLSLLATPALAAGPERPADGARSGWLVEFGDLVSRAVGLLFADGVAGWWTGDRDGEREAGSGIDKVSDADESDSGSSMDPDG